GFLETVALETGARVQRTFDTVALGSDDLFDYPFVVMTGEGGFTLTEDEKARLRRYVEAGGFLLASAGCSNLEWIRSFEAVAAEAFGDEAMRPLPVDHPVFATLYKIEQIELRKAAEAPAIY